MSNGTKITTPRHSNFSIVSNIFLRDKELSLKAKGLMAFMLSLPPEWDYSIAGLIKTTGAGKDAIHTGLKELRDKGYLIMNRRKDKAGRFSNVDYILVEDPHADNPYAEKSDEEKQDEEKPPQINTNRITTDLNNKKDNKKREKSVFSPPTLNEVKAYIQEKGYHTDPVYFYEFFSANDWKDSRGNKVKSWKQKLVTWETYQQKSNPGYLVAESPKPSAKSQEDAKARNDAILRAVLAQRDREIEEEKNRGE